MWLAEFRSNCVRHVVTGLHGATRSIFDDLAFFAHVAANCCRLEVLGTPKTARVARGFSSSDDSRKDFADRWSAARVASAPSARGSGSDEEAGANLKKIGCDSAQRVQFESKIRNPRWNRFFSSFSSNYLWVWQFHNVWIDMNVQCFACTTIAIIFDYVKTIF